MGHNRAERQEQLRSAAKESWIARNEIGFSVLTYDSVMGILRDKRWHSATGLVAQMQGIRDEDFGRRRRVSILNAEGEVHVLTTQRRSLATIHARGHQLTRRSHRSKR